MTPREHYDQQGYYKAVGLFPADEAATIKAETLAVIQARGLGDPTGGLTVWKADDLAPPLQRCVCDPRMVRLLQDLIGPGIEFLSVKPVFKDGKVAFGSPWHQDWFYWKGTPKISAWMALDAATPANGCLRIVPGSQTQLFPLRAADGTRTFAHRVEESAIDDAAVVDVAMQPGDVLFFHDRLLHSSYPNTSGQDRWSLIPTYRSTTPADDSPTWETALAVG